MKKTTALWLSLVVICGMLGGIVGYKVFNGEFLVLIAAIVLTLAACGIIMKLNTAANVSDPKKLKDLDDYQKALSAWTEEDTPFTDQIKIALNQLDSLERKQKALANILDEEKGSPFLTTGQDVEKYILANAKRILNRLMIYDGVDRNQYRTHAMYLSSLLQQNAKVLSDFENLILEVSQLGDDSITDTPCLRELTDALRSVREPSEFDEMDATPAPIETPDFDFNAQSMPPVGGNPSGTGFTQYGEQYLHSNQPNPAQQQQEQQRRMPHNPYNSQRMQ